MKWLILSCLLLKASVALEAQQIKIAAEGTAQAVIVVPKDAALPLRHGAEEIQHSIHLMSGAELPIVNSIPIASDMRAQIILHQDKNFAEEQYNLRTYKNTLTITGGGKRGVLYGCYALLEDVLGCRWYTSSISFTPDRKTVVVPKLEVTDRPAFEYREPYYTECLDGDWAARNRINGNAQHLDETLGSRVIYGKFVHTYSELVPPQTFFAPHPEYYSLINGKRVDNKQLCLTNPEVLEIAVRQVREWIKANPEATIFSVSQNDTYGNCQCDKCMAVNREEGAPSGLTLRFANQVAQAIEKEYPKVLIDTLGYQWTEDPPLHEKPRKNVRVRLAPVGACFSHAIDQCAANKKVFSNLKAWAGITDQLYIWHYCADFANYLQPVPDLDEIAGDIALFKREGVVGIFYEGDYAPGGGGEMAELKSYIMSKLMWNTSRPVRPLITEFLHGVYGDSAPFLQQWLDILHQPARNKGVHASLNEPPNTSYLAPSIIDKGMKLFEQAESAVKNQPVHLEQVQKARLALDYVLLMQQLPKYRSADNTSLPVDKVRLKHLAEIVENKIEKYNIQQVREGQPVSDFLTMIHSSIDSK